MYELTSDGTTADKIRWFSNGAALRAPMIKAINGVDTQPPHLQVLGLAAALAVMCDALELDPHDVVNQIRNATKNIDAAYTGQYAAMKNYVNGEFE